MWRGGKRRRTAFWRAAQNTLGASGAKPTRACVPRTVNPSVPMSTFSKPSEPMLPRNCRRHYGRPRPASVLQLASVAAMAWASDAFDASIPAQRRCGSCATRRSPGTPGSTSPARRPGSATQSGAFSASDRRAQRFPHRRISCLRNTGEKIQARPPLEGRDELPQLHDEVALLAVEVLVGQHAVLVLPTQVAPRRDQRLGAEDAHGRVRLLAHPRGQ